jgi:hypothetical protein
MWQDGGMARQSKACPECEHEFGGSGWTGIDAHWKAGHNQIMRYEDAWPLIRSGKYKHKDFSAKKKHPD